MMQRSIVGLATVAVLLAGAAGVLARVPDPGPPRPKPAVPAPSKPPAPRPPEARPVIPGATESPVSDTGGVLARRLIERVNHHRAKHGLGSLRANPQLDAAAQAHSETMLKGQCFEHVCAGEADLGARIERAGYAYRVVAENIAAGFEDAVTVVDRWMRSESHRENMLMPGLSEAGFGYVRVPRAADPLELGSYWTLDLGTPLHARRMPVPPPPSRRPSTIGAWEKTMGEAAKPGVRERSGPKAAEREIPGRPAGSLGRSQPVKRDR